MTTHRTPHADPFNPDPAPTPWTLQGDMFWLILTLKNPLPSNTYDSLTASTLTLDQATSKEA